MSNQVKQEVDFQKVYKLLASLIDRSVNYHSYSEEKRNKYSALAYHYKQAIDAYIANPYITNIDQIPSYITSFQEHLAGGFPTTLYKENGKWMVSSLEYGELKVYKPRPESVVASFNRQHISKTKLQDVWAFERYINSFEHRIVEEAIYRPWNN